MPGITFAGCAALALDQTCFSFHLMLHRNFTVVLRYQYVRCKWNYRSGSSCMLADTDIFSPALSLDVVTTSSIKWSAPASLVIANLGKEKQIRRRRRTARTVWSLSLTKGGRFRLKKKVTPDIISDFCLYLFFVEGQKLVYCCSYDSTIDRTALLHVFFSAPPDALFVSAP